MAPFRPRTALATIVGTGVLTAGVPSGTIAASTVDANGVLVLTGTLPSTDGTATIVGTGVLTAGGPSGTIAASTVDANGALLLTSTTTGATTSGDAGLVLTTAGTDMLTIGGGVTTGTLSLTPGALTIPPGTGGVLSVSNEITVNINGVATVLEPGQYTLASDGLFVPVEPPATTETA